MGSLEAALTCLAISHGAECQVGQPALRALHDDAALHSAPLHLNPIPPRLRMAAKVSIASYSMQIPTIICNTHEVRADHSCNGSHPKEDSEL